MSSRGRVSTTPLPPVMSSNKYSLLTDNDVAGEDLTFNMRENDSQCSQVVRKKPDFNFYSQEFKI